MLALGDRPSLLLFVGHDGELRAKEVHARLGRFSPWARFQRTIDRVNESSPKRSVAAGAKGATTRTSSRCCSRRATKMGARCPMSSLVDEMKTLLVAGHETTATALTWATLQLIEHPDVATACARSSSGRRVPRRGHPRDPAQAPIVPIVVRASSSAAPRGRTPLSGRRRARAEHPPHPAQPRRVARPRAVRPEPLPRRQGQPLRVLPLRRRRSPLHRHGLRAFEMRVVLRQLVRRVSLRLAPAIGRGSPGAA